MAHRRLLAVLLAVFATCLLASSPAAAVRPCHTFLVSFSSNSYASANPSPDHTIPLTATVITVFRVRRFGPHRPHHLHSLPAAVQIRRPDEPLSLPTAAADTAASLQERAKDILVVVVGLLFGVGCGALTAASMYLVWSVLAGAAAPSHYDELYDEDEASDSESPKKTGYVTIPSAEAFGGKK